MENTKQIDQIMDKIDEGVKKVYQSENYQNYLKSMAKFHQYSLNNCLLIWMQKPDATMVQGYNAWKTKFNRTVKRGEKGIRIIIPIRRKQMYPVIIDNELVIDKEPVITGYKSASVFDISQTAGDDLPFYMHDILPGMVKDYDMFQEALLLVSPVPVVFEDIPSGAHGYYQPKEEQIVIQKDMSEVQTIKTMLHEIAHSLLHGPDKPQSQADASKREIQAESAAYAICSYYGIDTSEYSFPYIAGWQKEMNEEELKASLLAIRNTCVYIINTIDRVRNPMLADHSSTLSPYASHNRFTTK